MQLKLFRAVAPALAAMLTSLAPATDLLVGPAGSGAPYTSIQAAVNAAQTGDRVIVFAGEYNGAVVIDNKSIEIIGQGAAATSIKSLANFVPGSIPPPLGIVNLPAGGRVRVSGFTLGIIGFVSFPMGSLVTVHSCAGRVELCDLDVVGGGLPLLFPGNAGGIVFVNQCAHVVATDVRALGSPMAFPLGFSASGNGLAGIHVASSSVWLADCLLDGNASRIPFAPPGGDGGPGLRAINSTVQVARSVIHGGQSGGAPGLGGAGISATASSIVIHGGSGNLTAGANGLDVPSAGAFLPPASAVALDAASTLIYGNDVVLTPGAGTATQPAAPPIAAPAGTPVYPAPVRLPTVSITPSFAHLGTTLTVTITGEPGLEQIRAVTLQTAPAQPFAGIVVGSLLVDLASVIVFHVEPIGPSGTASFAVPVPIDPSLAGLQIVEQGAQVFPFGIVVGPPILATLGF